MRSHHERFRWTHVLRDAKDSREVKENEKVVNELNSYRALAIVDKRPHSTIIHNLRNWEKDDTYKVVNPHRSGHGFSATGLRMSSPENHRVRKPSADEQLSVINFGKLTGSLQGAKILTIPSAEDSTGAIPVVNTEVPGEMFYYIPAQIEPLAMNRHYFENKPSFIVMKPGEMPSYVFWKRKAQFPPSYTASQLLNHQRTTRSGAPTPEPRPVPVSGPSTEPIAASLAVNTDKTTRVAREKQIEPEWEVFDPRLEENPLEFLDYYNACLNGRKGVRSKLMLREVDIDRVNYISPCLAHNHKKADKEAEAATTDAIPMDIDPVPILPAPEVTGAPVPDPSKAPAPKPWKQPEPISADDPAWKNFFARIDREKEIRGARIRPKPVFTSEYCNAPGTKSDPKKAILTRELYDKLYHRAVTADREIEKRSKCCFACGLEWTLCPTTRYVHYKQHREEFKLHKTHFLKSLLYVDDPLRIQDLDAAKAPMPKGVPSLNWFRDLEQRILDMENELLEREQLCRICDAHVDFSDESNADHYRKHKEERKQLRIFGDKVPVVPLTPPSSGKSTSSGFQESPEARTWSGWKGKQTPEFLKGPGRKRGEEEAAKEQAQELASSSGVSAQRLRETGHLQHPIQITSDVSSSAASNDLEDVFMDGLDGSIHSDVIGSTTAPLAFPPLFKRMPMPEAASSENVNLDFLSGQEADTVTSLKPEQVSPFGRFKGKERRNARQNHELDPDVMDIDAVVEAHLDYPIEIEDDDDDELYAYPAPVRADSVVQDEADFAREEIIQAIRTKSGELLALNDDSEDAEEVPEEFEDEDLEDSDANGDVEASQDEADNGDTDANDYEVGSEDEDSSASEFKRMDLSDDSASEDDNEDDDDDDDDEDGETPRDHGDKFSDLTTYPLSGGGFVIDEITDAATGDLPLTPTERNNARDFVQEMVEEALVSPIQSDRLEIKERVQNMTRNLFAPQETKTLDAAQTRAAKILAQATGHSKLRKMNIDLQQAFSAIDYALELVHPVKAIPMDVSVEHEQYIQERLEEYLFSFNPKGQIKRSTKAVTTHAGFANNAHLNTDELLHGIRLELFDVWRVMMKARDAFYDMIAANRKDSLSDIKARVKQLTRNALVDTWRHGYTDEPLAFQPVVPVRHDGLDLEFEDLKIGPLLAKAVEWGCGRNNMRFLADKAWEQTVGMVKQTRERASLQEQTPELAEQSRLQIVHIAQLFVRDIIKAEKRLRREQGQQSPQQKSPTTPNVSSAAWSTQAVGGRTPKQDQRRTLQKSPATPTVSSAKWSTEALASDTPRAPISPWSPVASVDCSPATPIVSGVSDKHDGLDIEFSDLEIDHLLTEAVESGCGRNDMRVLADEAWKVAAALQEETPRRTEESRRLIRDIVQQFVRHEIKADKRLRKQGSRSSHQKSSTTPTSSSAGWSTRTVGGRAPGNKRPSPLPTSRKRKASDTSFHPGPPTPFNPDEISPRLPKMPRKSNDPLYRPVPSPTTPPATPKLGKRSSSQKPAARATKNVEKKLKKKEPKKVEKKQAKKVEKKKEPKKTVKKDAKKVTFDTAQTSKSSSVPKPSTSSSPHVIVVKKPIKKTAAAAPVKAKSSKKSSVKKAAPKSGVKKTTAKAKKPKTVAPATRPKRQAAIEAEKSFGKTKVVG